MNPSANAAVVRTVLEGLDRLGVREVCVAAGARNAPLVSALMASRGVRIWNFFDERAAGFFALGRMQADLAPVAVLTTSGTAVGELLPAVMEAHYQGMSLVLVTADRPKTYRGSGAPQAVEQPGIFGCYAQPTLDLDVGSIDQTWPERVTSQPLHINVCLDEPLDAVLEGFAFGQKVPPSAAPASAGAAQPLAAELAEVAPGTMVVLAGAMRPEEASEIKPLLLALQAPVIAEATSHLLHQPVWDEEVSKLVVRGGDQALKHLQAKCVLRIGGVPSWRWWRDLEDRTDIRVIQVSRTGFAGLARKTDVSLHPWRALAGVESLVPSRSQIERADDRWLSQLVGLTEELPRSEVAFIRQLHDEFGRSARVLLGNSLPIREFNLIAGCAEWGVEFFANRGANGIDGLVSTFLGISATCEESWLVIGDLSTLYDLSAPWVLGQLPPGNRRIVVIHNGGGKIFARVKSLSGLDQRTRSVIENHHALDFEPWARMWGMGYRRCLHPDGLDAGNLPDGCVVIEVRPDPGETEQFWEAWASSSP